MKASLFILLALFSGFAQAETAGEQSQAAWAAAYRAAVEKMEAKYPDLRQHTSKFHVLLDHRVAVGQVRKDPALNDPNFILKWADQVAAELKEVGESVTPAGAAPSEPKAQPSPTPSPAPPPTPQTRRAPSPAEQDFQTYLEKVARGEAGVDPSLQTRARSGDPIAMAGMERQLALNRVTARFNAGEIDQAGAAAERQLVEQQYQAALQAVQLDVLNENLERITRELERRRLERR